MATSLTDTLQCIIDATKAKRTGKGWKGVCPAHDDRSPSLSIGQGDNRILLFCHAGCPEAAIVRALGLSREDVSPPRAGPKPRYNIVEVYDYRDEAGALLFQCVRYQIADPVKWPAEPRKRFRQRAPDGKGAWRYSLEGVRRVLYRLPELLEADPRANIWVVEGERDVERLRAGGLVATTSPMGAGKWRSEYSDALLGREVVIIPDNDPAGHDHAEAAARASYRRARDIRVLRLEGLPDKGDVSDWLDAGHTIEELCNMAEAAPSWRPPEVVDDRPEAPAPEAPSLDGQPKEVCIFDVQIKIIDWIWLNRIPRGAITIVEGAEGEGKSTMMCAIAAAVTVGKGLSDMPIERPANVLWLSAEDDLARVLKPRLLSTNADLKKFFAVSEPFNFDNMGIKYLWQMAGRRSPACIVIDPIFAYSAGDPSKGCDSRIITNRLRLLAEQFNCAIILVRHIGKSKGFGDPRAAGLYSIEWRAAARSVLLCGSDPDNPQVRALTQTKNNFGPLSHSIGYRIDKDESCPSGARFFWCGDSDLTASRILAGTSSDDERTARNAAFNFLKDALSNGERLADDIKAEAKAIGISEITLKRARSDLGIIYRREGYGKGAIFYWNIKKPEENVNGLHTYFILDH